MSVLVFVDVFDIFKLVLKVEGQDTIGDVKQLVEQATGIPHQEICIQYGKKGNMKLLNDDLEIYHYTYHDAELETIYVNYSMTSPTIQALRISNEILALQGDLKGNMVQGTQKGNVTITPTLVFLSCQGEPPAVAYFKDLTQPDGYPKTSASVVTPKASASTVAQPPTKSSYQTVIDEIAETEAEFSRVKEEHKARMKNLIEQSRSVNVEIGIRFMSGREINVQTCLKKSIKKFKAEDLSQHIDEEVVLMYGAERLQNNRRLFAYKISEGSVLDVAVLNPMVERIFQLKVVFMTFNTDVDKVTSHTCADAPFKAFVSPTTTVNQLIGGVLDGMRQFDRYQEDDWRFFYYLNGHFLTNDEEQNILVKDIAVKDDTIKVNIHNKNDRIYRIVAGLPLDDSSDEEEFEEVGGDDFTYLADYNFDVGDGAGYVEPINRDATVKVSIYPNAKDKRMVINLLVLPTQTVKHIMHEISDITDIKSGTFDLHNAINDKKLSETSLVSECPSKMFINLKMMGGGTHRDLKKVALKSKTLKDKIVSIRSSSTSTVGAFPPVLQLEEKFKEFYEMADANATLALETFGKRLDENLLNEIVAILGGGSSTDIKMKEIGERVFAEKLQEVKSICSGLTSTIENASVVFQWAFNRAIEQNNGNYDIGKLKLLFGSILTKKVAVREAKSSGDINMS